MQESFKCNNRKNKQLSETQVMPHKANEEELSMGGRIAVYARRWVILAAFCLVTIATIFGSKSFTVANHIYAAYFGVSLVILDWSCLALYIGAAIATPIFAWMFFKQSVGFRLLSITGTLCLLVSYLVIVLSIEFPKLYPIMVVSNFLQGVAYTICFTVGTSFAVLWFPDHQVGFAVACNAISFSVGTLSGAIVPPEFFENLRIQANFTNLTKQEILEWKNETRTDLLKMYTPVVGLLLFLLFFFISYVTDLPPKPPTYALLLKRSLARNDFGIKTFSEFVKIIIKLFRDKTFLLCCLVLSIVYNVVIIEIVHITDIVAKFEERLNFQIPSDVTGGQLVAGYCITCSLSAFCSATILNKWKFFVGQTVVGAIFSFLSAVGMAFSLYTTSLTSFCMCLFLYGLSTRVFVIPLLEIITRHTYPLEEMFVSVWVSGCGCIALVIFVETARLISLHTAPVGLMMLMCALLLMSLILILFIKPKDKRGEALRLSEAYKTQQETLNEKTKLLTS